MKNKSLIYLIGTIIGILVISGVVWKFSASSPSKTIVSDRDLTSDVKSPDPNFIEPDGKAKTLSPEVEPSLELNQTNVEIDFTTRVIVPESFFSIFSLESTDLVGLWRRRFANAAVAG